jgi:phage terminase large subunit-like protein
LLHTDLSLAERLALLPTRERDAVLADLDLDVLQWDWSFWGRPAQQEPQGEWTTWLILAGRGFGKTRAGAEWVRDNMTGRTPMARGRYRRLALVAETAADARDTMVQGESGIMEVCPPGFRPEFQPSLRKLTWPNGAQAHLYNAVEPDQLRGPQHDAAWCDELAKWRYAQETWDQLQFGLRLGHNPRQIVTTTPRPIDIIRDLLADDRERKKGGLVAVTRGRTYDNAANLPPAFFQNIVRKFEGTRLGRQELDAEVLDDVPGALWTRKLIDDARLFHDRKAHPGPWFGAVPPMQRVVVGVDPSGTKGDSEGKSNEVGIVVAGRGIDGHAYVGADLSVDLSPEGWGRRVAVDGYKAFDADRVVGESNYGGDMVRAVIHSIDRRIAYKDVKAARGKVVRAEPIAALYEQGKVHHVGGFAELEDQMVAFTNNGYVGRGSPDRADALVWALTELMLGGPGYRINL